MINGVINIYKIKGFTSHDVVAKLRGILKQRKIGHTGTLDPDAEGVYLTENQLRYQGIMQSINDEFSNLKMVMR